MGLELYRRKRKFKKTPEPKGDTRRPAVRALRFVVQKHHASRLHYDFRLELGGVMLSWAVPKGPSLNPSDRRLAVKVEDHPLEYRTFEGIIPEGNYGAGTVMVWDQGTYEPVPSGTMEENESTIRAALDKGHISFVLHGQKLRGRFALVRFQGGKPNEWFLFKAKDEFASTRDVTAEDRSTATGRSLDEISAGAVAGAIAEGRVWQSNRSSAKPAAQPRKPLRRLKPPSRNGAPPPHNIKPMLATTVDKPFDHPGWFFEIKWDGFRAIAEIDGGQVRLYSRTLRSYEDRFPTIVNALQHLAHDAILDGEIVVVDDKGMSHFQDLQNWAKGRKGTLVYYVFDLLYLDGEDLRKKPVRERKELLQPLLEGLPGIRYSEHVEAQGVSFFKAAAAQGLEGVVGKEAASPYRTGKRSSEWVKIKVRQRQEAVIGGFTAPRGSRKALGALVLGVYDGGELVYIGHTGGGFTQASLEDMRSRLEPLIRQTCPFPRRPKTNMPATWVEPKLVCEVAFQEWTEDGTLRQPIFLGLREDKVPTAVQREVPTKIENVVHAPRRKKGKTRSALLAAPPAILRRVPLSNLDKVYWPKERYTKGDLIEYYRFIGPAIVPHLKDRPLSLNRHPDGITGKSFFHKDVRDLHLPDFVETVMIPSESTGEVKKQIMCQNIETLLYVANLGCIEMNPWLSRAGSLERPDYLVIDIDPQDAPFHQAVEAAQEVRKLLEAHGAECYCKTSGKRGLHVAVPLGARYDFDHARQFAELLAILIHRRLPGTTSVIRDPSRRRGKVYLDFLQNRYAQTIAAAYSVRPWPAATVSTPLKWTEVTKRLDPSRFTLDTMARRVDRAGDLWQSVLGPGIDLARCLQRLNNPTPSSTPQTPHSSRP